MSKMTTVYSGGLRTESVHLQSGTKMITDAPTDNRGKGEAFSPTDLLTTSYTACILSTIGIAAMDHGFSIDGASAETEKIMLKDPRRVGEIRITITFPHNNYTEVQKRMLEHIVRTCPVAVSIHPDIIKKVELKYKGA